MIKFVLVYALMTYSHIDHTKILTTYATKDFCESTRKTLDHPSDYKCIPHQEIVVIPAE